jgi:hypothetical protein
MHKSNFKNMTNNIKSVINMQLIKNKNKNNIVENNTITPSDISYDTYDLHMIEDNKSCFRIVCNILQKQNDLVIPLIKQKSMFEAVLIEYRILPHLQFLIKNMILQLGYEWSHTVVCGTLNYMYMKQLCNTISPNINVIVTPYQNLNQTTYSFLLASTQFWNMFYGNKILIYQEDSIIFKKNINQFLKYDYVGAPWSNNQNDTKNLVGNGGFSLRTKDVMLKTINTLNIASVNPNSSTLTYMKNCKMKICPEDVYFCKTIEDYKLGNIPNSAIASEFSSECVLNYNSLGGHNFWLCDNNWINRILKIHNTFLTIELIKILNTKYKCVCIATPYNYNVGGGEKYLSFIIKFFIQQNYKIIFCVNTYNSIELNNTLNFYFNKQEQMYIYLANIDIIYNVDISFIIFDYFLFMNNNGIPSPNIKVCSPNSILHVQFPCDYITYKETYTHTQIKTILQKYNHIIVNSEFTYNTLVNMYTNYYNIRNIHIVYPPCFESINNTASIPLSYNPEYSNNTFVMIGRIFEYDSNANNKYFDVAIDIFNKLIKYDYKLIIIGSNKSNKYVEYLQTLIKNNNKIQLELDINDESKNKYLRNSNYFIQLTGIHDKFLYNKEHFGISMIEAINQGCIPISINEGYPKYLITNNINGYLINNSNELTTLLLTIFNKTIIPIKEKIDIHKFSYENFFKNMKIIQ